MQRHCTACLSSANLLIHADHVPCSDGTWTYKIPSAGCIPRQFNVTFLKVGVHTCFSFASALQKTQVHIALQHLYGPEGPALKLTSC